MNWDAEPLDLDAYLARLGYRGPRTADTAVLAELHRAHVAHIAFENIDVALEREISLDLAVLQRKLVTARRGGYCFEHNLLFAAALERLGFRVVRQLARVRRGRDTIRYRAHAALVVTVDGRPWLCDVGFGDEGLIDPLQLSHGSTATVGGWTWRVERETGPTGAPGPWVLRSLHEDGWFDLYAFTPETHYPVDFEVSNYYTAHSSRSTFTGKLIAMHGTEKVRSTLKNRELVRAYPDGRTDVTELSGTEMIEALREVFGVVVTDDDALLLRQRYAPS